MRGEVLRRRQLPVSAIVNRGVFGAKEPTLLIRLDDFVMPRS